jgi:hypothetical protein
MKAKSRKYRAMLQNVNDAEYQIEWNFQALDIHGAYDFIKEFQTTNPGYILKSMVAVYDQQA